MDGIQLPPADPFSVGDTSSQNPMLPAEAPAPAEKPAVRLWLFSFGCLAINVCCFIPGCAARAAATSCRSRTSSRWLAAYAVILSDPPAAPALPSAAWAASCPVPLRAAVYPGRLSCSNNIFGAVCPPKSATRKILLRLWGTPQY